MTLRFKQDHAGIKAGETLNLVDVRQRLEYAVYFSDAALHTQLVHAGIAEELVETPLRTATEKTGTKRKAVIRGR